MLINLDDYEQAARQTLTPNALGYYVGGADDEVSLRRNRTAFEEIRLAPKVLVDVSMRDTSTTLLGQPVAAPMIVAPMALMKLAHADGEIGMARAAGRAGVPMALSTLSTTRLEQVTGATHTLMWFQLYVYRDRKVTQQLVRRAEAAGYRAIILTADAPVAGNRERDIRNQFHLPTGIRLENVAEYALANVKDAADDSALAAYAISQLDPAITWDDLAWLVDMTTLPVLVKGILRADDARRAVERGAAGVIVSNHGGRQLDGTPAGIEALPDIVREIGGTAEILVDGGVRRGTDILKALALGAGGVLIGRPALWGLSVDGETGAAHVLEILQAEFDRAMALSGCRNVREITSDLIFR